MNRSRQIRNVIYRFQRLFGVAVSYRTVGTSSVNVQTGEVTLPESEIAIRKAIIIDRKKYPDIDYDLSFIAANKNFTYGGVFTRVERVMILLGRDLQGTVPKLEDYTIFQDKRYNIRNIEELDSKLGYILVLEAVDHA